MIRKPNPDRSVIRKRRSIWLSDRTYSALQSAARSQQITVSQFVEEWIHRDLLAGSISVGEAAKIKSP